MLTAAGQRFRHHPGAGIRRQRLCHQAIPLRGAAGPHPRPAAQHEHSEEAVFRSATIRSGPAAKLLLDKKGGKIRLTEKETSILKYLYRAGEKVISREVLLHEVWGYNAGVTTHTLETHIYRLRQKIERDPSRAELLITEAGGYKLIP